MQTTTGMLRSAALVAVALGAAACGIESQEAPSLIGPSGFSQSVTLNAVPDRLPRDGTSQSVITVTVRNESGQAVSGQRVTLGSTAGTLSQADVVTGSDGRATFTLTAPPAGSTGNVIEVFATPVGGDFANAVTRSLSIALTGSSNATAPSPSFTVTPAAPEVHQTVTFDASATTDEGAVCTTTCSFAWSFSDGFTASGRIISRTFTTAGTYNVTLTVTDAAGTTATLTRSVSVAAVNPPAIEVPTWSPDAPLADQPISFAANAQAAAGHRIVRYTWDFGDGTTATTPEPTINKTYTLPGPYVVTVTATDDLGQSARASAVISVSTATPDLPVARFTVTPAQPKVGEAALFDASASTAGNRAVIRTYRWSFGDGTTADTSRPTIEHTYSEARPFAVELTVIDNFGRMSTLGRQITVVP